MVDELTSKKSVEQLLTELDNFIGMASVKSTIREIVNTIALKKAVAEKSERNLGSLLDSHIMLTGNPGTGKSTLAMRLGEVFQAMGVLPTSKVHKITPASIKGTFVGETAKKALKAVDLAMGGILFIDEAYGLARDQFGNEAAEAIMEQMIDKEGKFLVIAAVYTKDMETDFLDINQGLARRFNTRIHIDDFTPEELLAIFKIKATSQGYDLGAGTEEQVMKVLTNMYESRSENFGNAFEVENLLNASLRKMATRIAENEGDPTMILPNDI